jgi:hypothetical protein
VRRLNLAPGEGRQIEAVLLEPVRLTPRVKRQHYSNMGPGSIETPAGAFRATRYRYRSLDTGLQADFWVDEDGSVLRYEGLADLVEARPS